MKLIFFIISLIILIIIINFKKSSFTNNNDFIAITYENDASEKNTNNLLRMFEKNGYNYKVLGNGEKWDGWYGRLNAYNNYIKTLDPETYILLCDGRDVIVNENYTIFINKAINTYEDRIIIGTERQCCTETKDDVYRAKNIKKGENLKEIYKQYMKEKALQKSNKDFYYLNFGMMFGKASDFINLFKLMDIKPGNDDQSLAYKLYYENSELFSPDYNQELLSNADSNWGIFYLKDKCFFKWNGHNWDNYITNTTPSIIQIPGKRWNCYNKLLNKLQNNIVKFNENV
jgi:uncharacterized protein YlzI (FlbEa/FlbD family)